MTFQARPLAERVEAAITREANGCWTWAYLRADGYGQIDVGGKRMRATRVVYELYVGPVSADLELDHLCRNPACVNPDHLEPPSPTKRTFVVLPTSASAPAKRTA